MKYLKNKLIVVIFILLIKGMEVDAQVCRNHLNELKNNIVDLVLTDYEFVPGRECANFVDLSKRVIAKIDTLLKCSELVSLKSDLVNLSQTLRKVEFDNGKYSQNIQTRIGYYRFNAARESFNNALLKFETEVIMDTLQMEIDSMINRTKKGIDLRIKRLDSAVKELSSIPSEINKYSRSKIDSLGSCINEEFQNVNQQLSENSPLFIGINWYTRNGLGLSAHYHFNYERQLSLLAGVSPLYRWQEDKSETFGIAGSGGVSMQLSNYNRVGFLLETSIMNGDVGLGGRLMGYTQHLAVGMGYTKNMGTGIALLIRFHDPR